jgi:exodeoxyribonuclease-3
MRIISWNVNGLRAIHRKGQWDWLMEESPDVFCLQETKAHPEQLPSEVLNPEGYTAHFSSSDVRKGYSGVVTYTKKLAETSITGMHTTDPDEEGRLVTTFFPEFVLCNVYFPNGGGGPERLAYKLAFYDKFLAYIESLKAKGHSVIFCGDVNTAHEEIDLARPKANEKNTGFLPEERAWIDEVVNAGYVDVFRHFNPNKIDTYTYWDMKTGARDRNVGWRIDYFFVSRDLLNKIGGFTTHTSVLGSDHCPIEIELDI